MVYIRVHSFCCTVYVLTNEWYRVIYHYSHMWSSFHCPKMPCVLPALIPYPLSTPDSQHHEFYCCHHTCVFQNEFSWNHTICSLFRPAYFISNKRLGFLCVFVLCVCFFRWLGSLFSLLNNSPLSGCTTVCLLTCWRTSCLLPFFTIINKLYKMDVHVLLRK